MSKTVSESRGTTGGRERGAQVLSLPLEQVEPYERLMLRFKYEVGPLSDLILQSADANAPNGQLNPGRVVPRKDGKKGYLVYVGVRRYFALKLLHKKTGEDRFSTFNAYVDSGLSELQMFIRAKTENEDERGERRGLSVLEEVLGLSKIRDSISNPAKELGQPLARRLAIADAVGEDRLKELYSIEEATSSKFSLSQLEALAKVSDKREFCLVGSCMAEMGVGVNEIDLAERGKETALAFKWFPAIFPELAKGGKLPSPTQNTGNTSGLTVPSSSGASAVAALEIHETEVIIIPCPSCSCKILVRVRGSIEVTQLAFEPNGEGYRATADTVSTFTCKCGGCDENFYALVKHLGGREYAVETAKAKTFREPKTETRAVDLRFDQKQGVWQEVVNGEIAGVLSRKAVVAGGAG
ncbi:MAG: hypothetical protein ABSA72_13515 [Nitrososphaerales archaeon]